MKSIIAAICAAALLAGPVWAQAPAAPKATPVAKLTARDIRALPFAREHKSVKFKPGTRELPDELTVSRTDHIRIWGKRKNDAAPVVRGVITGFIGQLALLPPGDRKGTLFLKKDFGGTEYFATLELSDDTLDSNQIKIKEGKTYPWTIKAEGGRTTLRVLDSDG
jgi:hypothetical protein